MSSVELRQILGGSYKRYIDYLKSLEVIESRDSYSNGKNPFTKAYRIAEPHFGRSHLVRFEICKKLKLTLEPKTSPNRTAARLTKLPSAVRHVAETFHMVHFNLEEVRRRIELEEEGTEHLCAEDKKILYKELADRLAERQKECLPIIDDYGRVHYLLTFSPRLFRPGISLRGKRMVELDIANSQLLPLCIILLGGSNARSLDVAEFTALAQSGEIYNSLKSSFGWTGSHKDFKSMFFRTLLYGSCWTMRREPFSIHFHERFPAVWSVIYKRKTACHKQLARDFQEVESSIVFADIVPALQRAGIRCLTIHDALVVTEGREDEAEQIIMAAFAKHSIECKINRKIWSYEVED